jgi:hypothetical protein
MRGDTSRSRQRITQAQRDSECGSADLAPSDISDSVGLGGCHARKLADDGNGQVRLGANHVLEAVGWDDKKGDTLDGPGRGGVRRIAEQGHLPEQISNRESPKKPLSLRRSSPDLNCSVVDEIGLPLSSYPLTKDHLPRLEDPRLHAFDLTPRSGHLWPL